MVFAKWVTFSDDVNVRGSLSIYKEGPHFE